MKRCIVLLAITGLALHLGACATLPGNDPLEITVAGLESLPGEGLELRMLVKLRVLNPNDQAVDYNGVYLRLDVQDRAFATGASEASGTIPRFGEALVSVPVTISALRMARQMIGVLDGQPVDSIRYDMRGKLSGSLFRTVRFKSQGEFSLAGLSPAKAK